MVVGKCAGVLQTIYYYHLLEIVKKLSNKGKLGASFECNL